MTAAWTDREADATVARYADEGVSEDLALRVYTSRLLGRDPLLVLHGGGNTSVKTTVTDLLGEDVQVLCVKGSGWDMADIEPPGLPAVRMEPLLKLRSVKVLSDAAMVRCLRLALLANLAVWIFRKMGENIMFIHHLSFGLRFRFFIDELHFLRALPARLAQCRFRLIGISRWYR